MAQFGWHRARLIDFKFGHPEISALAKLFEMKKASLELSKEALFFDSSRLKPD